MIRILAFGDVVGRAGRQAFIHALHDYRSKQLPNIVLVNGENLAGGFGITSKLYHEFVEDQQVDAITTGNHWHDNKEILNFADQAERLVRPANMENIREETMGLRLLHSHSGTPFAVINLIGRVFMKHKNRSPFDAVARLLQKIPAQYKIKIVDVHAEASSEKQAMMHFLSGKVSLVYGTHSHVPTADERILDSGTAYITDIGATAAYDSIIGMDKHIALKRMLTDVKQRMEPAQDDPWACALEVQVDPESGRAVSIRRHQWRQQVHQS